MKVVFLVNVEYYYSNKRIAYLTSNSLEKAFIEDCTYRIYFKFLPHINLPCDLPNQATIG